MWKQYILFFLLILYAVFTYSRYKGNSHYTGVNVTLNILFFSFIFLYTFQFMDISALIKVPFDALFSSEVDEYRKPLTKMWHCFSMHSKLVEGVDIDSIHSFYVGI